MKYKSNSESLTFSFRLFDIIEFSDLRQPFLALKSYFFKSLFRFVFWALHWPLFKRAILTFPIWKIRFWPSIGLWAALLELVFDLAFMNYVGIFKLRSPESGQNFININLQTKFPISIHCDIHFLRGFPDNLNNYLLFSFNSRTNY